MIKNIIQIFVLFISFSIFSQVEKFELDSLLNEQINELKIDDHGIFFSDDSNPIKSLNYFRGLIKNKSSFKFTNIVDGNSTILIAKDSKLQIIQIKTTAYTKIKKSKVLRYNYLIKKGKTKIYLEFDENGIRYYQLKNKRNDAVRESIMILTDEFDEEKFIEDIEIAKKKYLK